MGMQAFLNFGQSITEFVVLGKIADNYSVIYTKSSKMALANLNFSQNEHVPLFRKIDKWLSAFKKQFKGTRLLTVTAVVDNKYIHRISGQQNITVNKSLKNQYDLHKIWSKIAKNDSNDQSAVVNVTPISFELNGQKLLSLPMHTYLGSVIFKYVECRLQNVLFRSIFSLCDFLNLELLAILPEYLAKQSYLNSQFGFIEGGNYINVNWESDETFVHVTRNYNCQNYFTIPQGLNHLISTIANATDVDSKVVHKILRKSSCQYDMTTMLPSINQHSYTGKQVDFASCEKVWEAFNRYFYNYLQAIETKLSTIINNSEAVVLYTGIITQIPNIDHLLQQQSAYKAHAKNHLSKLGRQKYASFVYWGAACYQAQMNQALAAKTNKKGLKFYKQIPNPKWSPRASLRTEHKQLTLQPHLIIRK